MRRAAMSLGVLALTFVGGTGGCVGPDALVGVNGGDGGSGASAGSGGAPGGAGGSAGGDVVGASVTYILTLVQMGPPDVCMPRELPVEPSGAARCRIYAVPGQSTPLSGPDCGCTEPGRGPVDNAARDSVLEYLQAQGRCSDEESSDLPACTDVCLCEAFQAEGADLASCQDDLQPDPGTNGWCYVAPDAGVGAPELVSECREVERRRVLFYGDGAPRGETLVLACATSTPAPHDVPVVPAPIGEPCVPADEYRRDFSGYQASEVTVESNSPACASGLCLVNHFEGRVSCPYGQFADEQDPSRACFVPGSDLTVEGEVFPQFVERAAANTVICSCRCDGPGDGPFCACPSDMTCAPLIAPLGLPSDAASAGSYCIPNGTEFDPTQDPLGGPCISGTGDCGDPRPY